MSLLFALFKNGFLSTKIRTIIKSNYALYLTAPQKFSLKKYFGIVIAELYGFIHYQYKNTTK